MIPDYREMNASQRWAINKLHRVSKTTSAVIIYFHFAELFESPEKDIDLNSLILNSSNLTRKAEKKRFLVGLKELRQLNLLKLLHSHNWRHHKVTITPLNQLTKQLRGTK